MDASRYSQLLALSAGLCTRFLRILSRSGAVGLRGIYGGYGEIIPGLVVSNSQFKAYAEHIYIHIHKFNQGSRF